MMISNILRFWTLDRVIELFIVAVAIAAFSHSQWSFSTQFQGLEPSMQLSSDWLAWFLPGALMALALDIGQIATSRSIKKGHRSVAMYVTFVTFSGVTYFLQFLFIVHHMPAIPLSTGVADQWRNISQWISDASIWLMPAALPLITFLYTVSYQTEKPSDNPLVQVDQPVETVRIEAATEPEPLRLEPATETQPDVAQGSRVVCPQCGKDLGGYTDARNAAQRINGHKTHCAARLGALVATESEDGLS